MKIEEAKAAQVEIQKAVEHVNLLIQKTELDVQLEVIPWINGQILVAKCYIEPTILDNESALISEIKNIMSDGQNKLNRIEELIAKST